MKHLWSIMLVVAMLFAIPAQAQEKNMENLQKVKDYLEKNMENLQKVKDYLTECKVFYVATTDGDQPRVRPFGVAEIYNGRLYIMTGKSKRVFKQITANPKFEIIALKPSGTEWIRISGKLNCDDEVATKEFLLDKNPGLKGMYSATDNNMAALYITEGTATMSSFMAKEETINF